MSQDCIKLYECSVYVEGTQDAGRWRQCTQSVMTVNSLARLLFCLHINQGKLQAQFSHSQHHSGPGLGKPGSKQRCNLISFCQIFSKNHIIAHIFGHLSLTKWMQNRGTVTSAPSRSQLNVVNQRQHVRMVRHTSYSIILY